MAMGMTLKMGEGIKIGDDLEIFYTKNRGKNTVGLLIFSKHSKTELKIDRITYDESKMGFKPRTLFDIFKLPNTDANCDTGAVFEPGSLAPPVVAVTNPEREGDGYS